MRNYMLAKPTLAAIFIKLVISGKPKKVGAVRKLQRNPLIEPLLGK
jgi:protein required for attachment to host cells